MKLACAGFPIPDSPERLIAVARRLDRFWSVCIADGWRKPTLAEELELWRRFAEGDR